MSVVDELEKLNDLKERGVISEEEYEETKASLLGRYRPAGKKLKDAMDKISVDTNVWGMFIHLSQFCGYVIPLAGLIVPIILWQVKKTESDIIDRHGRIVANWIITAFILGIIFGLLSLIVIGIPLLVALGVVAVVFPIVGGLKANNGEVWRYPGSIGFFKLD